MKMQKVDELINEIEKMQRRAKKEKVKEALSLIKCCLWQLKTQELTLDEKMLVAFELGVAFDMWDMYKKPKLDEWFLLREKIIDVFIEIAK
jgi:hypothetical protein